MKGEKEELEKENKKLKDEQENDQKRRKCCIISDELSNKLHQIYSKGKSGYIPPIKFIDLDLTKEEDRFEFLYFGTSSCCQSFFQSWIEVNEESLRKEAKVLHDGTLFIPFMHKVWLRIFKIYIFVGW